MFTRVERMMAARYLLPRRGDAFVFVVSMISLLGITLGVAALVSVMSVMNGFRADLFDRILGVNGHALVQGYDGKLADWQQMLAEVRATPGVVKATPLVQQQAMVSRRALAVGAMVRGMRPEDIGPTSLIGQNLVEGSVRELATDAPVIALGARLAAQLAARVGDTVSLIAPEGQATPFGMTPRIASYRVVALFEIGVYDYDNLFVVLPLTQAQTFFRLGEDVGGIEIVTVDPDTVGETLAPLRPKVSPKAVLVDWRATNRALFEALGVERVVMFWILSIIILVAVFNIISSLIMLVRSKSRDIAILRTMGASYGAVMRIFVTAGLVIGGLGTVLGVGLGFLLLYYRQGIVTGIGQLTGTSLWNPEVRFLTEMPAKVDAGEIGAVVALTLVLTLLATLYPAWKAAATDPVKVLRYD